MNEPSFPLKLFQTFVSLTNLQRPLSKIIPTQLLIPRIFVPRYANGADLTLDEAERIMRQVPSLNSEDWTRYWIQVGRSFEEAGNLRAACMSYIVGSFPKETAPWKSEIEELKKKSFKAWCSEVNAPFLERAAQTPRGKVRYYLCPATHTEEKAPLIIFLNGLEGSCEEFAFPLHKFIRTGASFAILSLPGTSDYECPMTTDSDQMIRWVIDDLVRIPFVDAQRIGMVGFSFGAYWTLICAKTDSRIKFSLLNGLPLNRTFSLKAALHLNPIVSFALLQMFQIRHPIQLLRIVYKLRQRGLNLLHRPSGPLLGINGDRDTIVDPRDTADLSQNPGHRILWIKDDDHLGLFHYFRMVNLVVGWCRKCLKGL